MYHEITSQARTVVTELLEQANLKPGCLLVVGCSSSEMVGKRIGKGSSMDAAQAAFQGIYPILQEQGIQLAVQCCEHLNRALIMERTAAEAKGYEIVKKMCPGRIIKYDREIRTAMSHLQTVEYITAVII